jgi:hypothetical protein
MNRCRITLTQSLKFNISQKNVEYLINIAPDQIVENLEN